MAAYKVWLTVKDSFGNTKEVDGGTINIDLATLSADEINHIEDALPLEDYLRKDEAVTELDPHFMTTPEVEEAIDKNDSLKYSDFKIQDNGGN